MKPLRSLLIAAMLLIGLVSLARAGDDDSATNPRDFNTYYAPAYRLPDLATMTPAVARGKELVRSTYKCVGAQSGQGAANGRPFVGDRLACTTCHMADGTQPDASPFVVVAQKYANPGVFNARSNILLDVPARVNTCMERSLAGESLPRDSQARKDIVAYIDFLATGLLPGYTFKQVQRSDYRFEARFDEPGGLRALAAVQTVRNPQNRLRVGRVSVDLHLGKSAGNLALVEWVLGQFEEFCVVTHSVRLAIPVNVRVLDAAGTRIHSS